MKFFIPQILDAEGCLNNSIFPFIKSQGFEILENSRVFSITFQHNNKTLTETVGQFSPTNNEQIFVILETINMFLVCTKHRGLLGGNPLLVGKQNVISVKYFIDIEENTFKYKKWTYKLQYESHRVESPMELPQSLYKYYNYNPNSQSAIMNNYLFCSHPFHLNDSMDCSNKLWDFSNITRRKYDDFFLQHENSVFINEAVSFDEDKKRDFTTLKTAFWKMVTDKAGIISLSESPLHTLMWAHYSSEKGFMVEFDRTLLITEIKTLNPQIRNYVFMPIQYVDALEMIDFFSINFTSADIPFLYSINIKKNDWQYENEWRLVCYSESYGVPNSILYPEEDYKGKVERKCFYNKAAIKSLTLGKQFFNGSNLAAIKYPKIYVLKDIKDVEFVNYIHDNFNEKLYISDELISGRQFSRNRRQIKLQKIETNTFKVIDK